MQAWIKTLPKEHDSVSIQLEGWLEDYFYKALDWVTKNGDYVVDTTLVGVAMNGLSHLVGVSCKVEFICALSRGLGANLKREAREKFAKEVFQWAQETHPDPRRPLNTSYDPQRGRLLSYHLQVPDHLTISDLAASHGGKALPLVLTPDVQRGLEVFRPWLSSSNRHSFLVVGPEGCGKELLLRYSFEQLRSVQVAIIHCSAQTSAVHVIQKLAQLCMVISTNTGRVYRPRDSERLILYLKDPNLPKPDKWGTSQIIAFLQQVRYCGTRVGSLPPAGQILWY